MEVPPVPPLAEADTARIRAARQYGHSDLRLLLTGQADGGTIELPDGERTVSGVVERAAMTDLGWTLLYVAETNATLRQALLVALAADISCLALALALAAASQRRQRLRSEQAMRLTLERRVAERTADLSTANARLREAPPHLASAPPSCGRRRPGIQSRLVGTSRSMETLRRAVLDLAPTPVIRSDFAP